LEEQPEAALLSAFGARRIPSRPLTYANHLLSSSQRQSSSQSSGNMGGGVPSVVGGGIVAGGGTHVPQPHQQQQHLQLRYQFYLVLQQIKHIVQNHLSTIQLSHYLTLLSNRLSIFFFFYYAYLFIKYHDSNEQNYPT